MTRDELIAALEAADGPSRELDAEILRVLVPDIRIALYCIGDEEPICFGGEPYVDNRGEVPAYTGSLDAALSLVPSGRYWGVETFRHPDGIRYAAWVHDESADDSVMGQTVTPAIALALAAIRARGTGKG